MYCRNGFFVDIMRYVIEMVYIWRSVSSLLCDEGLWVIRNRDVVEALLSSKLKNRFRVYCWVGVGVLSS